jgi:hypothetical protein
VTLNGSASDGVIRLLVVSDTGPLHYLVLTGRYCAPLPRPDVHKHEIGSDRAGKRNNGALATIERQHCAIIAGVGSVIGLHVAMRVKHRSGTRSKTLARWFYRIAGAEQGT